MGKSVERLYRATLASNRIDLNDGQDALFQYACQMAIAENPTFHFDGLVYAVTIYLKLIRDNPSIDLGPINPDG